MRKVLSLFTVFAVLHFFVGIAHGGNQYTKPTGERLFRQHCAACHPKGGNIIDPNRTLNKSSMASHGIRTADDIIRYMRSPGPGMPSFDERKLSGDLARDIAEYILHDFK